MPPVGLPSNGEQRVKKSKLEKICELEASLKVAKEENRKLRKEIHMIREVGPGGVKSVDNMKNGTFGSSNDFEKMKDAVKALKQVTITQEMSLNTMRAKAQQRRKELKDKDTLIMSLQRQLNSLNKTLAVFEGNGSDSDIRAKMAEMHRSCQENEMRCIRLEEELEEKKARILKLESQLETMDEQSFQSKKSLESASTKAEFDVSKLKKELAGKAKYIVELEQQLENSKDIIHELQQRQVVSSSTDSNFATFGSIDNGLAKGGSPAFGSNGGFADFGGDAFADFGGNNSAYLDEAPRGGADLYSDEDGEDDFW